mmetsp:Transcript_15075/g.40415  ORF Transcript_15075/g.40415 Transcript_15075/m.40415 type:complete len:108 (-) Transcript_15075:1597-1920(-)
MGAAKKLRRRVVRGWTSHVDGDVDSAEAVAESGFQGRGTRGRGGSSCPDARFQRLSLSLGGVEISKFGTDETMRPRKKQQQALRVLYRRCVAGGWRRSMRCLTWGRA